MREHEGIFILGALDMLWFRDLYLPNEADRAHPDASPLLREGDEIFKGMAPAWVGVAELGVLRSEGEMYAEKMKENGVDVTLRVFKGATHATIAADRVSWSVTLCIVVGSLMLLVGRCVRWHVRSGMSRLKF